MKKGDYIRTLNGINQIEKYEYRPEYENCHCLWLKNETCGWLLTDEEAKDVSSNVIDLIKVGDYVNGSKVLEIKKGYISVEYSLISVNEIMIAKIYCEEDIKTIVTKEQFEEMEFKL